MSARTAQALLVLIGLLLAVLLALALKEGAVGHYTPGEVLAGKAPIDRDFRMVGQVRVGSLTRETDGSSLRFVLSGDGHGIEIRFNGIPTDLFREGRDAVVQGRMNVDGVFIASAVLARHDENYLPPENGRR